MSSAKASPTKTSVILIDDHAVLRGALAGMLAGMADFTVLGDFGTVHEALDSEITDADVIIQDVTMPDVGGLAALPLLRERFPRARVLMLSMHPAEVFGLRAFRAGAQGYLTKEASPQELTDAIRSIAEGRLVVPPEVVGNLAVTADPQQRVAPHEHLSEREFDVLKLMAAGERPSDIAERLQVSIKTVSTYRRRILDKLGLETNADLVRYALENELADG
jgi:two-component system invasion response regulator UvrY